MQLRTGMGSNLRVVGEIVCRKKFKKKDGERTRVEKMKVKN